VLVGLEHDRRAGLAIGAGLDGDDLAVEAARGHGGASPLLGPQREAILGLAADLMALGHLLGGLTHARRIVGNPVVLRGLNASRARAGRPPLELEDD
jgi:hypothetical protein